VNAPTIVILAAGQGTRMRSRLPKVLHDLCGRPMIAWPVAAAREAGASKVVVVDGAQRPLDGHLPDGVELVVQPEPNGTGGAVLAAAAHFGDGPVVILNGDAPLVTAETLQRLLEGHAKQGAQATLASMELADPSGYGRIVRRADGTVARVVETKVVGDATAEELAIREVNAGLYAFDGAALKDALRRLAPDNAQGELYLPSTVELLEHVAAQPLEDPTAMLGVNDRAELAARAKPGDGPVEADHPRGRLRRQADLFPEPRDQPPAAPAELGGEAPDGLAPARPQQPPPGPRDRGRGRRPDVERAAERVLREIEARLPGRRLA
jgi:bifunctional UDP-N-acetylglucosamine pyrophosphorylase/glucosamine-1-phosphate N-acetyltransferase